MRRLLFLLLFSIAGYAQTTTTVTGTIKDLSGSVVTSGQVTFQLQPGLDTTISGSARFSPSIVTCGISGAGAIKALDLVSACTVTYNTALIPQNSYYKVCIQANFVAGGACFNWYALVSSFDLTTAVPTPGTAPAFTFVDLISSQTISGIKTFSGANSFSGVNTFSGIPVFPAGISGTAGQTLALPSSADTLVGRATTDTLTNKTLGSPTSTGTDNGTETLGNKTFVAPILGVATGTSLALGGGTALTTTNQTGTGGLVLTNAPDITRPQILAGVSNNGSGLKHNRGTAGCTTAASAGATCTTVVTWGTAFADNSYTPHCSGVGIGSGVPLNGGITSVLGASVTFQTVAGTSAAAQFAAIDCSGIHD